MEETKYHYAREIIYQLRVCYAISPEVYLHWIDKLNKDEKNTSSNSEYKSPMAQSCLNCPFRVDDDLKAEHCSNYKCDVWKRA